MKQSETLFKAKKRYVAIMVLCFLYGGFSIILFLSQAYSLFWRTEVVGATPEMLNNLSAAGKGSGMGRMSLDPFALLSSPIALSYLGGGIIAILAGITIWHLIREKEIKSVKQQTADNLLLPDEKVVINALKKSDYELTQAKLVKKNRIK